jgi:hypothetical protein
MTGMLGIAELFYLSQRLMESATVVEQARPRHLRFISGQAFSTTTLQSSFTVRLGTIAALEVVGPEEASLASVGYQGIDAKAQCKARQAVKYIKLYLDWGEAVNRRTERL